MPLTEQISTTLYFGCLVTADRVGMLEEAGKMYAPFICLKLCPSPEVTACNWKIHLLIFFSFVLQVYFLFLCVRLAHLAPLSSSPIVLLAAPTFEASRLS